MLAHMKMSRTRGKMATVTVKSSTGETTSVFEIPKTALTSFMGTLRKIGTPVKERHSVTADEVFKQLDKKYGRAGSILRGARAKEGLTQEELAEKAGIEQADLSKMENGKLSIGRERAKRLGEVLRIDYRLFL